jgi:ABC-2 type transport system permease protein
MSGRSVGPVTAIRLSYQLLVRQLITRGRVIALLAVGLGVVAVAWAVGVADDIEDPKEAAVGVIAGLGFSTVVPIVSLVFASASLGDAREDGTLVYLWLRPMDRWPVVVGAYLAAVTASLPITVVPLSVAAGLSGGGGDLVTATVLASVVGVLAYSGLFVLFGLLVKNSIVWGLGFILVWEGLIATFASSAADLTIAAYNRSIVTSITEVDIELADRTLGVGIVVPLVVAAVSLVLASRRLRSMDVA